MLDEVLSYILNIAPEDNGRKDLNVISDIVAQEYQGGSQLKY